MTLDDPQQRSEASHEERTYRSVGAFCDGLASAGVREVVASPGSRSTPLVLCADAHPDLRVEVRIDERSAAYYALGLALATGRPTLLICTSGTAAANFLPAVTEAHNARVPLVIATADRPARLRGWGANQTIDQHSLYGTHVRHFAEVQLPLSAPATDGARYMARLASRAAVTAMTPVPGPVHINFGFEEPLTPPDGGARHVSAAGIDAPTLVRRCSDETLERLRDALFGPSASTGGVVVAGPLPPGAVDDEAVDAVATFCATTGWPLLAEATSQLRRQLGSLSRVKVLTGLEELLGSPSVRAAVDEAAPGVVLRIGAPPTSAALRAWLADAAPRHVLLGPGAGFDDPTFTATHGFDAPLTALAEVVSSARTEPPATAQAGAAGWLERLTTAHDRLGDAVAELRDAPPQTPLSGLHVAAVVVNFLGQSDALFCSNSMPVRDVETVMTAGPDNPLVYANRGASGIDGVLSTAAGVAAGSAGDVGGRTTVLMGDLAFRHGIGCLAGLFDTAPPERLTVVVVDDGGGGIFRRLAVANVLEGEHFERLFVTPVGGRAADVAAALSGVFGFSHVHASTAGELVDALSQASSGGPAGTGPGVSVITTDVDPTFDSAVRANFAEQADGALNPGAREPCPS